MQIGIDASNLRSGGTITHVAELLAHAHPERHGIDHVVVWAGSATMERIPIRPWLDRVTVPALDHSLPRRVFWQQFVRSRLAEGSCDLVFAPGATTPGSFRPYVSMSVNMLPFDARERARYGITPAALRLMLLRTQQQHAFHESNAVIYLTQYAQATIGGMSHAPMPRSTVIPSGVNDRFRAEPASVRPLRDYSATSPFVFLYVSDLHPYKHHENVAKAVAMLRAEGLPVALDIIGAPIDGRSTRTLHRALENLDPASSFIRYLGPLAHDALPPIYRDAGAFVFASTCENLPMTLVEAMASGLPVAASRSRPMPDILGGTAAYFDADDAQSIAGALRELVTDDVARARNAAAAFEAAKHYSWDACADATFALLARVIEDTRRISSQSRH
jgi:glycosyltransferase involved in cell wall biosynthesis